MSTITSVLLTIPACPDAVLSPNARSHWSRRASLVRDARWLAETVARNHLRDASLPVFDGPVTVRATIAWGRGRQTVDADNALAMLKPTFDGLNRIVWEDDRQCMFLPVEQQRDPAGVGFIVIEVSA